MGAISAPQSEDCLTLNVWAPAEASSPRPVIVWIHGGGFMSGAGSLAWYDGEHLARTTNAIVVNINYRLGALGFLVVPEQIPGNLAVLDQELALHWVQDNISAFGGDPSRVTVIGQSGGGHNIAMLLTLPRTEGLFSRAVLLSAPLGIGLQSPEAAQSTTVAFLHALGLNDGQDPWTDLHNAPIEQILEAQTAAALAVSKMAEGDLRPPFMPVSDGDFSLPGAALIDAAAKAAADRNVEIVIGWTRDEANLFYGMNQSTAAMDDNGLKAAVDKLFPDRSSVLLEAARRRNPTASFGHLFMDVVGDVNFRLPALAFADAMSSFGGKAYVYQFDWASPDRRLGACHCIDLPFLFGTFDSWSAALILAGADIEDCAVLTGNIMRLMGSFANGNVQGLVAWDSATRILTLIDTVCREVSA